MRHILFTSAFIGLSALVACGDDTNTGGGGSSSGGGPTTGGAGGEGAAGATGGTGGAGAEGGTGGAGAAGGVGGAGGGVGANGPGFTCDPAEGAAPTLAFTVITDELDRPVGVRSPPGRPDTLFIWESHQGTIRIHENGALLPNAFLNIEPLIRKTSEEGFLGLAFHPDYATNGRFFVHYSAAGDGRSTIAEYHRSDADPNVADPDEVQRVLDIDTEEGNHNGGALEFGNDGYLYISFGDGGGGGDPDCDAQDLDVDNLLGKLVRLDVDGTPDENGYPAAPGNPEGYKYYHVGLRNPWRFSFDRCNGDLYIGDVGQGDWEEVNAVTAAEGPLNFGWPYREGAHNFNVNNPNCPAFAPTYEEPIAEYSHENGCSITGGVLYRGSLVPSLRGTYFYGDNCSGTVWMLTASGGTLSSGPTVVGQFGSVAGFGNDGNGEVCVVDLSGTVARIDQE